MVWSALRPTQVGNISVFFGNRVFIGPDWHLFLAAFSQILIGTLLFVCYTNLVFAARVLAGIFGGFTLIFIVLCGTSDPGIAPKEPPPPLDAPAHETRYCSVRYTAANGELAETQLPQKWCYSCNIYRPFRGVHCRFCDVCVCRRDHHCPWTGICVGGYNYFHYFCMVWFCFLLTLTAFIGGIQSFVVRMRRQEESSFLKALTETFLLEFLLILASAFWGFLVGMLAFYHAYLACTNMTSGDSEKRAKTVNIFNQGSILANLRAAFCFRRSMREDETMIENVVMEEVTVEDL